MKTINLTISLLFFFVASLYAQSASSERRLALVIGNKDYVEASVLKNPINDANAISSTFKQLGFEVTTITNADYKKLSASINQFTKDLRPSDVVVLYYSGHGIGYNGKNYIIPIDAQIDCLEQIDANGISTDKFMLAFEAKRVKNSFIFLDACRNLPDSKICSNSEKGFGVPIGLSRPSTNPSGSMIAFATREGKTASDNPNEDYSLFTNELLKHLTLPNLGLRQILDLTKQGVEQRSKGSQSPSRYDELSADFYFVLSKVEPVPKIIPQEPEKVLPKTFANKYLDLPFAEMAYIPGGTFEMGDTRNEGEEKEIPVHTVKLDGFYMGKYEVTVGQFATFIDATNYKTDAEKGDGSAIFKGEVNFAQTPGINWRHDAVGNLRSEKDYTHPVTHVTWNDARAFTEWLSKRENKIYRLPTEAEWEYAAGSGKQHTKYSWGNGEGTVNSANLKNTADGYIYTAPVGKFSPNGFGLYDMSGNVEEWCNDWISEYGKSSVTNPKGRKEPYPDFKERIVRGGSWFEDPEYSRVAARANREPDDSDGTLGFRVVLSQ